jgi:hypothetical protein
MPIYRQTPILICVAYENFIMITQQLKKIIIAFIFNKDLPRESFYKIPPSHPHIWICFWADYK